MKGKLPVSKKVVFIVAPLVALAITGTAFAFWPNDTPAPVASKNTQTTSSAQVTPVDTPQTDAQTAPAPAEAPSNPVDTASTPEENKTAVMQKITNYAGSRDWSESTTYAQTSCFDRVISTNLSYDDYNALFDNTKFTLLNDYLAGKFMFDGAVCKLTYLDPQS